MDINDRSLRNINLTIKGNFKVNTNFQITAASEIMAILCLSKSKKDLKNRIDEIIIGYTSKNKAIFLKELNITDDILLILKDAIKPNIIQSSEGNPAIMHGGPFANVAHGCNSIIATDIALKVSDYVVTEAGFGSDLGAEKFLDIKSRVAKLKPNVIVIVATIYALKMNGGVAMDQLHKENIPAIKRGITNLERHIQIIKNFNKNFVIAVNHNIHNLKSETKVLES
jgi:formate--tetrahydrofolate ligase